MMLGFCCEYRRVWFERLSERLVRWALWSSAAICGLSMVLMLAGLEMKILVIVIGALLLAPCLLAYLFGCPMPGVAGLCLKWMGERTYSIYLWQQPFTICRFLPQILHPVGAVVSVAVGGAWFHWFERPFLSVSRRPEKSPPASRFFWWPKIIAGLAAILLLVALVVVLISRPRYEATLRRQIWPVNPQPLSVQSGPSSGVAGTLLLLGDSRMAEWGVPEFGQWKVVNAGTVGFTTGQVRLRASEVLEEFRPDTVVLQAGINDLKYLGLEPEMVSPIVSLAYSNIVAIVDECVRHHSRIVVLETWPAGRPPLLRRLVWSDQIASGVEQLNAALRGLDAPHNGVRVVDLFRSAALNAEGDEYRDTLHFKPEFYRRLTPVLARELGSPPSAK
jgi:lysophospholipase L1-like esterase